MVKYQRSKALSPAKSGHRRESWHCGATCLRQKARRNGEILPDM
jgi:hypothetical protein